MPENVVSCPLCGSAHSTLFDRRLFHDQPVANRLCASCGLVFQSPRLTQAELDGFYAAEYRRMYQGEEGPSPTDLAAQRGRADHLVRFASARFSSLDRCLDIGCSAGLLLQGFQSAFGSQPVGVEPGDAYRLYAQQRGLSVYSSIDALSAAGEPCFDLISLAHVLEHLPDPVAYLERLRRDFLKEGGWLLLEVPNLYSHTCFEIAHLISFSAHTLLQAVKKAGFKADVMKTHGLPRSQLLPLYITLLARPDSSAVPGAYRILPERNVALKRKLGFLHRRLLTRFFPRLAWLPLPAAAGTNASE